MPDVVPDFLKLILASLSETYKHEVSTVQAKTYAAALTGLKEGELKRAALLHMQRSKWFPKPSELRELVMQERRTTDTRGPEPKALPAPQDHEGRRRVLAEVEAEKREQRADPVVKGSVQMLQAWKEAVTAIENGLPAEDAYRVIGEMWRDLMPRGREADWRYYCDDCRDQGLVRFTDANDREFHRPCRCRAGESWRLKAEAFGTRVQPVMTKGRA